MTYSDIIEQQGLIIIYQVDKPQLFIDSVNHFVQYSNEHPEYSLEDDTNILFKNENKEILADEFAQSIELCVQIAKQPEFQQAFIELTTCIVKQKENVGEEEGYVDDEWNHGQDLMHGLVEIGKSTHLLIERWLLAIDWDHAVEQSEVIFSALEKWGSCEESFSLAVLKITTCYGQSGSDDFVRRMPSIIEDEKNWDGFCAAALNVKDRLKLNDTYYSKFFSIIGLSLKYYSGQSEALMLKMTYHATQTPEEFYFIFKEYINFTQQSPDDVLAYLDKWIDAIKHNPTQLELVKYIQLNQSFITSRKDILTDNINIDKKISTLKKLRNSQFDQHQDEQICVIRYYTDILKRLKN